MIFENRTLIWNHGKVESGQELMPPRNMLPGSTPNREVSWMTTAVWEDANGDTWAAWNHGTTVLVPGDHNYVEGADDLPLLPAGWEEDGTEGNYTYYTYEEFGRVGINYAEDSVRFETTEGDRQITVFIKLSDLKALVNR